MDISKVLAISDVLESKTITIPDQSLERSVELQIGQTFPTVIALHFLQANSRGIYYLATPFFSLGLAVF
jgi:hypothetical protein